MEQQVLAVEVRSRTGKGISRKLRNAGSIPGIVYGRGSESLPVSVNMKELLALTAGDGTSSRLIRLSGNGLDGTTAIISEIQRDAVKGAPTHVDIHKVDMTEKVKVHIPVRPVGAAAGVREGGLLDVTMHALDVECLPGQMPEAIEVDVTDLRIGHSIHIGEIQVPEGLKILGDPKAPVISILGRAREEAPAAE